jgi:hypothetical protein
LLHRRPAKPKRQTSDLERVRALFSADRFTDVNDLCVKVIPILFQSRSQFASPFAFWVSNTGLPLECWVRLQNAVINRLAIGIE